MTTVGLGATLSLLGVVSLLCSPYLARGDAQILRTLWPLDLTDRGIRLITWSRIIGSLGFVIFGILLMVANPDINGETWNAIVGPVVATFMIAVFILSLVLMIRLWL